MSNFNFGDNVWIVDSNYDVNEYIFHKSWYDRYINQECASLTKENDTNEIIALLSDCFVTKIEALNKSYKLVKERLFTLRKEIEMYELLEAKLSYRIDVEENND